MLAANVKHTRSAGFARRFSFLRKCLHSGSSFFPYGPDMAAEGLQKPPGIGDNHPQDFFPAAGTLSAASRQSPTIQTGRSKASQMTCFRNLKGYSLPPFPFSCIKNRKNASPAPILKRYCYSFNRRQTAWAACSAAPPCPNLSEACFISFSRASLFSGTSRRSISPITLSGVKSN